MSAQRAINVRSKVSALQSKLSHAAKQSLDRRFGALYDKIYREDVIAEAWKRVRANKGAPGVDRQDFEYIEDVIGVDQFLAKVHERLKSERYRPQPVLRWYIAKPGKPEKRPLGIPVIFDRVCQQALVQRMEPIFEPRFSDCSFGYRPGRSPHMAMREVWKALMAGYGWGVDADLRQFFDTIDQERLIDLIAEEISDGRVLALIRVILRRRPGRGLLAANTDGRSTRWSRDSPNAKGNFEFIRVIKYHRNKKHIDK